MNATCFRRSWTCGDLDLFGEIKALVETRELFAGISKFLMIFPVFEAALIHRHNPLFCCNTVAPILTRPSFEVPHRT